MYDCLENHGPTVLANSQIVINNEASATPYVESLKPSKKGNMTPETCYIVQLTQIPGVSSTIAQRINEEYSNFRTLLNAFENSSTQKAKEELLANLVLSTGRRIGPAVSKKVYDFLLMKL